MEVSLENLCKIYTNPETNSKFASESPKKGRLHLTTIDFQVLLLIGFREGPPTIWALPAKSFTEPSAWPVRITCSLALENSDVFVEIPMPPPPLQSGPLAVISKVMAPINGVITLLITGVWAHLAGNMAFFVII